MPPNPEEEDPASAPRPHVTTVWQWQPRRRGFPLRRRKVATVRLGGRDNPAGGGGIVGKMVRKMKVRWVKLQYICMVRRVKEYYRKVVKDMAEAGNSIDQFQQRVFMESTFAIPVGLSFSTSYPSRYGPPRHHQPRPLFM